MRAHAKATGDRFKLFLLFVDAVLAAPEPRLMHKWSMRRVHQADNSLVHVRRKIAGQVRDLIFLAEGHQFRSRRYRLRLAATRRVHVNPNVSIMLFAPIVPGENSVDFKFVLVGERGNFQTAATARIEFPAMIAALNAPAVKAPIRKRNAAMRTGVAHGKGHTIGGAAQHQRHF